MPAEPHELPCRGKPPDDAGAIALENRSRKTKQGVFQASSAPAPHDGADHSREKQGTRMAYREHGKDPVPLGGLLRVSSSSFVPLRG